MPVDLKPPLSAYFDASNAHDSEAVAALFSEGALVHDESADHRGPAAIREWAQATYDKYGVSQTPRESRSEGAVTVVTTRVEGTFPGSPIELTYRFIVEAGKIRELRIG
jgi:ketosteroid isomerase-like protein